MLKIYSLLLIVCAAFAAHAGVRSDKDGAPVQNSALNGVRLPAGAMRVNDQSVPAEINDTLDKLVALGQGKVRRGASELLIWNGGFRKSNRAQFVKKFVENLQSGGWTYAVGEENAEFTVFNSINTDERRGAIGFWTAKDDFLMLAWAEMLPVNAANNGVPADRVKTSPNTNSNAPNGKNANDVLRIGANADYVNVMGNEMPPLPQFAALPKKPGFARGYVKDWTGKPLAGAYIGVRGVGIVGTTGGAHATTDANGYYEVKVPWGSADYYAAGYTIDYGAGRAALSLHPADGDTGGFASVKGAVENFVLLPYGITSRNALSESARLASTYYGGSIWLSYGTRTENDCCVPKSYLSEKSEIEITLTPEGEMLDGTSGRSFVIRKNVGSGSGLSIHNIPVGRYKLSVKQSNGVSLKMTQIVPLEDSPFAMQPRETVSGAASVLFYPNNAEASMALAQSGRWKSVEISLEMP